MGRLEESCSRGDAVWWRGESDRKGLIDGRIPGGFVYMSYDNSALYDNNDDLNSDNLLFSGDGVGCTTKRGILTMVIRWERRGVRYVRGFGSFLRRICFSMSSGEGSLRQDGCVA